METIIRAPMVSTQTRQLKRISAENCHEKSLLPHHGTTVFPSPAVMDQDIFLEQKTQENQRAEALQRQHEHEQALSKAFEQAKQKGFVQGMEEAKAMAKKSVAEHVERLLDMMSSLDKAKENFLESAEDAVIEIAYTAVCRLMGESASSRNAIIGIVNQALAQASARSSLLVRLNPQDIELIEQAGDSNDAAMIDQKAIWQADASIALGGCIVESDTGMLDARLEVQLDRLRQALLLARKSRSPFEHAL